MAKRSGDTAFDYTEAPGHSEAAEIAPHQSGVAPLFPLGAALHIKPRRQVEENETRQVIAAPFFLLAPAAFWRILFGYGVSPRTDFMDATMGRGRPQTVASDGLTSFRQPEWLPRKICLPGAYGQLNGWHQLWTYYEYENDERY